MKCKKLLVIFSCLIMIATIPVAAGATNTTKTAPQKTNLIGWVIIRGFVFAWKEYGNEVHARAIRIHYTSWDVGGRTHGSIIGREIIFKDRFAVDQIWSGPFLGLFRWVFGIYHGEIEIRG